ncbi:MAG: YjjG family noncanonical pyrimidine nucleotidase [Pisciglobus halotolerans]|nr:YjjG family noncanonical pyrimidine nucleotidase [Pisciglobus halotolerans]
MDPYRFLLFDLDNTLLDFNAAEGEALKELFKEYNIPFTRKVQHAYNTVNKSLWQDYEKGNISRDVVLNTRFSLLFESFGYKVDGSKLESSYRNYLTNSHQLIKGSIELMDYLVQTYHCYALTNGVAHTQHRRLRDSSLLPYFQGIFVSEEMGFQKPMKEFFDNAFSHIPNFSADKALMIGDSLSSDIQGGINAGVDTCWFNPKKKVNQTGPLPTYEVSSLDQLYALLSPNKINQKTYKS